VIYSVDSGLLGVYPEIAIRENEYSCVIACEFEQLKSYANLLTREQSPYLQDQSFSSWVHSCAACIGDVS